MTSSKIPQRMMPFFGLPALIVLSLILSGCGPKTPQAGGDTQQTSSTQQTSDYESTSVAVASGEASSSNGGEYDSGGSKVTFAPPSYRNSSGTSSPAFTSDPAEMVKTTSAAGARMASVAPGYEIAYSTYSAASPVFHGVNVQGSDPVFHGAHTSAYGCPNPGIYSPSSCGNSVDPVFHGAHY